MHEASSFAAKECQSMSDQHGDCRGLLPGAGLSFPGAAARFGWLLLADPAEACWTLAGLALNMGAAVPARAAGPAHTHTR